jgi:uncharacterized protein YqeY
MSLLSDIKAKQLEARKARNAVASSLLTTLIGEASMPGKNDGNRESTDAEVIAVVKKFIKNAKETLAHLENKVEYVDVVEVCMPDIIKDEIAILETFLPKQLSDLELRGVIAELIASAEVKPNMGTIMSALKTQYEGRYDGGAASKHAKELLV